MFLQTNSKRRVASILIAGGLALTLAACASRGPDRPPQRGGGGGGEDLQRTAYSGLGAKPVGLLLASMDRDGDRRVHVDEFRAGLKAEWASLNSGGGSGALNFSKWSKSALGSAETLPSFVSFDSNLDGKVSESEFTDLLSRQFVLLDANSDDVLERSELLFRIEVPRRSAGESSGRASQGGSRGGGDRPPRR